MQIAYAGRITQKQNASSTTKKDRRNPSPTPDPNPNPQSSLDGHSQMTEPDFQRRERYVHVRIAVPVHVYALETSAQSS